ncbi:MAG: primosomal protein N' [Lachnospiraceae bacterium]|nr:primosomal protein N' [Lachnospiraceae bacterium]
MYADVIVNISSENVDKPYQYLVPDTLADKVRPGCPVVIPFGSRTINGYVIDLSEKPQIDPSRIKPITGIAAKINPVDGRMISLAWWIKDRFGGTMNQALKTVIPSSKKIKQLAVRTIEPVASREELSSLLAEAVRKHHTAKERFLRELIEAGKLDYSLTVSKLNIAQNVIAKFETDHVVRIRSEVVYRNPFSDIDRSGFVKNTLNPAQQAIADEVKADIDAGNRRDYLIHGVTGSGKTEIYLDIIEHVIENGRQVIMLIPEIALTYQTVKRFYMRFGDRISVMNSKLSAGERYDQYLRAKRGETDIVIGPRSALFTPFERLGLIIIDEEHEGSYKAENVPAYHAREVAFKRGEDENAPVILGSATPSLEAYTMARAGLIKLFKLDSRAGGALMPTVHVADMREELKAGNRTVFSRVLRGLIEDRLNRKEQTMLFLNRRGYSGSVSCRSCGHVIKCPHCDISMTLHNTGNMVCHYCGHTEPKPDKCPKCGSAYISSLGLGTQKVEEKLKELYPSARILRMDADTTASKDSYERILSAFANEEADILIGTQMIVKGHDFHKCTLVGILMADMSLFAPDFRAGERTFQLLTQASGRAGRGAIAGDVVIQTYNPENYCIEHAAKADYEGFYEEEYGFRKVMNYPPARCMLSVLILSTTEDEAAKVSEKVRAMTDAYLKEKDVKGNALQTKIIGPADAPLAKARDIYRKIIYIKAVDYSLLIDIKDLLAQYGDELPESAALQFNFNGGTVHGTEEHQKRRRSDP